MTEWNGLFALEECEPNVLLPSALWYHRNMFHCRFKSFISCFTILIQLLLFFTIYKNLLCTKLGEQWGS